MSSPHHAKVHERRVQPLPLLEQLDIIFVEIDRSLDFWRRDGANATMN